MGAEVEFEDKLYEVTDGPEFSRECWFKEKFTLGLNFPNLPYFIDGETKVCRSGGAIVRLPHWFCQTVLRHLLRNRLQNEGRSLRGEYHQNPAAIRGLPRRQQVARR